jgi:hypothetical protein
LFSSFGEVETTNSGMIIFYPTYYKPHLPHHVVFHILVVYSMKWLTWNILCTAVDEGASTCVMSLACWKVIGQHDFSMSPMLLTVFDGRYFRPRDIISSFPMQLEGNTMCVKVEVVDAPLNYNILLGPSQTYAMTIFISTIFQVLCFAHEGWIITVDQLSFSLPDPSSGASTVSMFNNPLSSTVNLGA